jgi:hypothetical protein
MSASCRDRSSHSAHPVDAGRRTDGATARGYAGLRLTRPTRDVDMILHIDSGAATFAGVQHELGRLGYVLREPSGLVKRL